MRLCLSFHWELRCCVTVSKERHKKEKTEEPITVSAGRSPRISLVVGEKGRSWIGGETYEGGMKINADSGRISYDGKIAVEVQACKMHFICWKCRGEESILWLWRWN